ncbi:MAG: mannose-1-phosphate guanylyltransferase [Candidatus Hydrothermia bacterium]
MNFVAGILSGGKGERFWPLSRDDHPKQFLKIAGNKTLIEMTYERIRKIPDCSEIVLISNKKFEEKLKFLFPDASLILEPVGKNTAPACAVANEYVMRKYGKAVLGIFPSDHYILEDENFVEDISHGIKLAEEGYIVTVGIKPDRVETGYGYIEIGERIDERGFKALKFHEKPDPDTAKKYVESGRFFWNAGMFIWRVDIFDMALKNNLPEFYEILKSCSLDDLSSIYEKAPSISVDYAIMEKEKNIAVVEASFSWEDLGSFPSLKKVVSQDDLGNVIHGNVAYHNCEDCVIIGDGPLVAAYGLKDIVVVSTRDVVLVIPKEEAQNVKKLREILKEKGLVHLL